MAQEAPARTKIPTTGARRGRAVLRRAGEGRPHGTRPGSSRAGTPPRFPPTPTWPGSARRWPQGGTGTATS
jgi:hypothetical protein